MKRYKNLFATVLTYAAPSANYRGEGEASRNVIQRIGKGGKEYAVVSPESIRNALRETLAYYGLPHNRTRLPDAGQPAVEFKDLPDAEKYADDFLFGFLVAKKEYVEQLKKKDKPAKSDSVFRQNLALATSPYRYDATLHQSPQNAGKSPWKNSNDSALLHREVSHTAFQFPFALAYSDCRQNKDWVRSLLEAISELNNVAGNHARSYFEMAPKSIVARLTPRLAAGFDTYGFQESGEFSDLSRIKEDDLPGSEFWVGGELVRSMPAAERERLQDAGVKLYESPERLLSNLAEAFLNQEEGG
jgi:CRISPR-associated protein Cst2